MSLRAGVVLLSAVALAFAALTPGLALADSVEAADAIAGKFAADEAKQAADAEQDAKWLHEEARRAVERALALENARAPPAGSEPLLASDPLPAIETKAAAPTDPPRRNDETAQPGAEHDSSPATRREFGPAAAEGQTANDATDGAVAAADPVGQHPQADGKALERESKELADKLRDVRRKHDAEAAGGSQHRQEQPTGEPGIVAKAVSGIATQVAGYISPLVEKRVSILIVMEVGQKGVRAWSKTADPMLCIHESCYLSRGPDEAAEKLTRSVAFGPSVALGKRGQACRSKPACIFRDIDLETVEAKLQPVDLRFMRHDRRQARAIRADASCAILDGELSCRAPVAGEGWRAWIVPESVAERAGANELEAALAKGLN